AARRDVRGGAAAAGLREVAAAALLPGVRAAAGVRGGSGGPLLVVVGGEVRGRLVAADAVAVAVQVLAVVVVAPGDVRVPGGVRLGAVLEGVGAVVSLGGGGNDGERDGGDGHGGRLAEHVHREPPALCGIQGRDRFRDGPAGCEMPTLGEGLRSTVPIWRTRDANVT